MKTENQELMRNSKNMYDSFSMFGCNDVEVWGLGGKITLFSGQQPYFTSQLYQFCN